MTFDVMQYNRSTVQSWILPHVPKPLTLIYDWAIHLRFGDIWGAVNTMNLCTMFTQRCLPLSYYTQMLPQNARSVVVVVQKQEPIVDQFVSKLRALYPETIFTIQSKSLMEDFATLMYTPNLICSMSTLSILAAFLSPVDGRKIALQYGYLTERMLTGFNGEVYTTQYIPFCRSWFRPHILLTEDTHLESNGSDRVQNMQNL